MLLLDIFRYFFGKKRSNTSHNPINHDLMKYYTQGIAFDELSTVLRIYRRQGKTLAEVLAYFDIPENRAWVTQQYETLTPITVKEAIAFENNEQRMAALRVFSAEEVAEGLEATLLDAQTIHKKQIRWQKNLMPYTHEFEDTYELYKIPAAVLNLENTWRTDDPSVYFVKCKCASTDRQYILYVPREVGEQQDAIVAIAWTMRFNGIPLNKEQYLNFMYSET